MKKRVFAIFAALAIVLALAGCRSIVKADFKMDDISKAQKIVIADASGKEKAVLETEAEIDAFIKTLKVEDGWDFAELPEGAEKAGSFTLWQEKEVMSPYGTQEAKSLEICTFTIYDQDYLTVDTGVIGLTFTFSIPESAGSYLRGLTA